MQTTDKPQSAALERLLRDNYLRLVWNKDRQIIETRSTFVPIAPAGFRWPKRTA